jgi:hypothetical protein
MDTLYTFVMTHGISLIVAIIVTPLIMRWLSGPNLTEWGDPPPITGADIERWEKDWGQRPPVTRAMTQDERIDKLTTDVMLSLSDFGVVADQTDVRRMCVQALTQYELNKNITVTHPTLATLNYMRPAPIKSKTPRVCVYCHTPAEPGVGAKCEWCGGTLPE